MTLELKNAYHSTAFQGWGATSETQDQISKAAFLHKFSWKERDTKTVSDISWSCNGRLIAAAFSEPEHLAWCNHESSFAYWGIGRSQLDQSTPTGVVSAPACLSSIAFHTHEPSLLAVGSFNGELLIYDLNAEDPLLAARKEQFLQRQIESVDPGQRDESLATILWSRNFLSSSSVHPLLITGSLDGHLTVWSFNPLVKDNLDALISVTLGVDSLHFPDRHISSGAPLPGITAVAPLTSDPSQLVIGTEGGGLALTRPLVKGSTDLNVSLSLQPHTGHVTGIHWQSNSSGQSLLSTTGVDGRVYLFNLQDSLTPATTVLTEFSINSSSWLSPSVFVLGTGPSVDRKKQSSKTEDSTKNTARILVYDLSSSTAEPLIVLESPDLKGAVVKVASSPTNPRQLLCGTSKGEMGLWLLPAGLVNRGAQEWDNMTSLLSSRNV